MSSSESSEDENSALLREAVDTQFIHDAMFSSAGSTSTSSSKSSQISEHYNKDIIIDQPSLRPSADKDDQFNMLGVTPQFQEYVAKQLSSLLDEKLQKRFTNGEVIINQPRKRKKGGVKLLKDSRKFLKISKKEKVTVRKRAKSESEDETKFSEVSISANDILNKKGLEYWSTRSKAPVFKYKKTNNGTLISIE